MRLILASQSPRRKNLLEEAGFEFTVQPSHIDEALRAGETPGAHVRRLAFEKAAAAQAGSDDIVLGADTVVLIDNMVLGKPQDDADAGRMLALLSGREHVVLTAVCIRRNDRVLEETAATSVWFSRLNPAEIDQYVETGEPMDKAGAYAIQGIASRFVERIEGSYSNVVGLPVAVVHRLLQKVN